MINNERQVLSMKREQFRVEIRRKQLEDIFNEKRRKLLTQEMIEVESQEEQQPLVKVKHSGEFFVNLLSREINEETLSELNEVLASVQYQLENGNYIDFLQWAGPLDIVRTVIEAMNLYSRSVPVAQGASRCLQSLVQVPNKRVREQVKENIDQAIQIYKGWFFQQHPELIDDSLKGLDAIFTSQDGVLNFLVPEDMIDKAIVAIQSKQTPEKLRRRICNVLGSSTQFILSDERVIQVLKIAQSLLDSQNKKDVLQGLRIIESAAKNENNSDFVMGMGSFQNVMDMVYVKEQKVQELAISILIQLSCLREQDNIKKLISKGILDYIHTLLKDGKRSSNRSSAALILSNLMFASEDILEEIINHPVIDQAISCMEHDHLSVRRELFYAWVNFSESANRELIIKALNTGVLQTILRGIDDHEVLIIKCSLKVIESILTKIQGNFDLMEQLQRFLQTYRFEEHLFRFQTHPNDQVYLLVHQIINNFYSDTFE